MSDNNRDSTVPGYGNIEIPENKSTSVTLYNPEHPEFDEQSREEDTHKREFYEAIHRLRDALGSDMKFVVGKWARMLDNLERGEDVDDGIEMLESVFRGYVGHEIEISLEGKTGLSGEMASKLHRGDALHDGCFTLEYNRDSEGYYYLIHSLHEGKLKQRCHFKRVERTGENMFNLADLDQKSGVYLTLKGGHPRLYAALVTLSNVTPDKVEQGDDRDNGDLATLKKRGVIDPAGTTCSLCQQEAGDCRPTPITVMTWVPATCNDCYRWLKDRNLFDEQRDKDLFYPDD